MSQQEHGFQGVEPGDLVFHGLDGFAGAVGVSDSSGKCSPVYHVCAARMGDVLSFVNYSLRAMSILGYLEAQAGNVRQRAIDFRNWDTFATLEIPRPPVKAQRRLVDFLDAETARIDALVAKKRRLAKLLEDRWIGELDLRLTEFGKRFENGPIHALCSKVVDCVNKTAPTVADETDYVMLRTSNVSRGAVRLDNVLHVDAATYALWTRRTPPRRGDVLLTREAPVGNVGILNTDRKVFLGQRLMMYRADLARSLPNYLLYCLWSPETHRQIDLLGAGSLHEHLRVGDCSKLSIPLAPRDEQERLVRELSVYRQRIDKATETLAQQIDLLVEHRDALITAAVTGQVKIPGAAA